jgi:hypothetical protein
MWREVASGALLLLGCDSGPTRAVPTEGAETGTTAGASVATVLTLASGATLRLPAGAEPHRAPQWLPDEVQRAHVFRLGSEARLLMVTELGPPPQGCEAALAAEHLRMVEARDDTDEARRALRRVGKVEELTIAGRRVLYGESEQRGLARPSDAGRPFAGLSTLMMCAGRDRVVLMLAAREPGEPADARRTLLVVAASFVPAPTP